MNRRIRLLLPAALALACVCGAEITYSPKYIVEAPAKNLLARSTAAAPPFANPKVTPGKVRWHADFDAACRAAKKSGKPVLLFQMMGNLDEQFC